MSTTIVIISSGRYITVAVALNKLSVSHVVSINALKALAVGGHLYGIAVALSIVIRASKLTSVGIMYDYQAIHYATSELPFEDVAIFLGQFALALLLVLLPRAAIYITIAPHHGAIATAFAVEEVALIVRAIVISEDALSRFLAIEIVTLVHVAIGKGIFSAAVGQVLMPVTRILIAA